MDAEKWHKTGSSTTLNHSMNPPEKLVIEAGRAERQYWYDLWRYRELFQFWRGAIWRCDTNRP